MEITKKNRSELKSYFLTNKIPTQKNFEEFIDAGMNQADDGIVKAQGRPLAIQAEGDDSGTQEVLQLYKKLVDNNPSWSINMNPRTDPNNTATGKLGLNISDAAGLSRLFIKNDDGNIGIGTITPVQKLQVQVNNNGLNLPVYLRNTNGTEGGNAVGLAFLNEAQGDWPKAAIVHERTAGFGVGSLRFLVNGNLNNGTVSLADTKMTIQNTGNVSVAGSLGVGMANSIDLAAGNKMTSKGTLVLKGPAPQIDFADSDHGQWSIHVNSNKMYFIRDPWLFTDLVLDGKGNVGFGTDTPQAKLQVVGGAIQPAAGNSETAGIMFPKDPGGGSGDAAYLRYYARTGESMTLELGIGNDADDNISLMTSGGVGIDTLTPGFPLTFNNNLGDKISLWGQTGAHYGFGIQAALLQIHTDGANGDIAFGYGTSAALTETVRFKGNGNVGIGTKDPKGKLHVAGSIVAGNSDIYFMDTEHTHTGTGNAVGCAAIENAKNYNALMILGRTTGTAQDLKRCVKIWDFLQVESTTWQNVGNYFSLSRAGIANVPITVNVGVSIRAQGRIVCEEVDVLSDRRIKKEFTHSDPEADLRTLNQLRITDFRYKDEVAFGGKTHKGLIAQEVETVFPAAVSTHADFVPDIFTPSESVMVAEGTMTITMKEYHGLNTDDVVRILTASGTQEVSVTRISDRVFSVEAWEEDTSEVFVYGKKVNDIGTVNYNSIFALGISAIQELYKQVQSLKEELFGIKNLVSARLAATN